MSSPKILLVRLSYVSIMVSRSPSTTSQEPGSDKRPTCDQQVGQTLRNPRLRPPVGVGRIYDPSVVNLDLVRAWLTICDSFHGDKCSKSWVNDTSSTERLPWIYAIDVNRQCLAQIPHGERYVALSYVWGSSDQLRTMRSNLNLLSKPGGLSGLIGQVPRTIRDAIDLTGDLGFNYLWVDSLCIVQDDDDSKRSFIPHMHVIYGAAWLSIIAQTAENASVGLQGYRVGTRNKLQAVKEILPGLSLGVAPHYGMIIHHSKHAERGWTYETPAKVMQSS